LGGTLHIWIHACKEEEVVVEEVVVVVVEEEEVVVVKGSHVYIHTFKVEVEEEGRGSLKMQD
jgi:hypothetical protein